MAKAPLYLLAFFLTSHLAECYKILVVFPIPNRSHTILGNGIVNHLLDAGHEVTYVNPYLWKTLPKNLRQIDVSANELLFQGNENMFKSTIQSLLDKDPILMDFASIVDMMDNGTKMTYANEDFQKVLNDPSEHFDLVIIEWMFSEASAGLSAVFNCPFIWVSTIEPHWLITRLVDEALNPAYNDDNMGNYIAPFNFWQRVKGLGNQIILNFMKEYVFEERKIYENIFTPILAKRGKPLPPFDEIKYNASLILGNSHVSIGVATRLPQIYKPIGGYHIDPKVKPLPEDLQKLLDTAKNGLIYFSLGSNCKSTDLPESIKRNLLKMFGGLRQTVLWKFEENLTDLPTNVHIVQWAPQPSILAHPNCVLFITHGGLLSTIETIHFGVPVIGIPIFADQFSNVLRAETKGIGKKVEMAYSLAEDLNVAIQEIINNPSYRQKTKELSVVYHDRVAPPGAELVHWVEHVVRTRGAPHLRSPALMVPWYQKTYLDLLAIIVIAVIVIKKVIRRIFCSKRVGKLKKNN